MHFANGMMPLQMSVVGIGAILEWIPGSVFLALVLGKFDNEYRIEYRGQTCQCNHGQCMQYLISKFLDMVKTFKVGKDMVGLLW